MLPEASRRLCYAPPATIALARMDAKALVTLLPLRPQDVGVLATSLPLLAIAAAALVLIRFATLPKPRAKVPATYNAHDAVYEIPGITYFGSFDFLRDPYAFVTRMRSELPASWYRFKVCGAQILVPMGDEAKKLALRNDFFSLTEGYRLLAPGIDSIVAHKMLQKIGRDTVGYFLRHFSRTETIAAYLKPVLKSTENTLKELGDEGTFDPIDVHSRLVFQTGLRITLGDVIADDWPTVQYAMTAFRWFRESTQPTSLIFPLLPTPARIRCLLGGYRLWRLVQKATSSQERINSGRQDLLQSLLDDEADTNTTVRMIAATVFASSLSSSAAIVWLHIYLTQFPEWRAKVMDEIAAFRQEHVFEGGAAPDTSLADALGDIPLAQWEAGLPTLERCLLETIRLIAIGTLPRRNIGPDRVVDGHTIRSGDFVLVMLEDIGLNPEYHDDPRAFKPDRDRDKVSRSTPLADVHWGYGKNVCPGQRFARCTLKLLMVVMLSSFDFELLDQYGNAFVGVPAQDTRLFEVGMPKEKLRFRYKRKPSHLSA